MGPASEDIREGRVVDRTTIEISLNRPSAFLLEALDIHIARAADSLVGTGPFLATTGGDSFEMRANETYYGGAPSIKQIDIVPYTSIRAAWADMLRGQVDMLYDVGVEALDLIEPSKDVQVFPFRRGYAFMVLLNVRKPYLKDPEFRQQLNTAIDREALVANVLRGHGTPAYGPVWPEHWAFDADLPQFTYEPRLVATRRTLKMFFVDPSHEHIAIAIQRQLQAIGVDLELEVVPDLTRAQMGNFDLFLADYVQGPNLYRPYLFWHSGSPYNWGGYSDKAVDEALDVVRHATNDETYKAGVADFQRAMVNDPPAIFLAWRERSRAVTARFVVPAKQGADILSSLHLWRPATEQLLARGN
jgi:peptide/nickel transport system substrate-binding protein